MADKKKWINIFDLCNNYKPSGLVKYRYLPQDKKFYFQKHWVIGLVAYWIVSHSRNHNVAPKNIDKTVRHLENRVKWPRNPMHCTLPEMADFLYENLKDIDGWDFDLRDMCEKIACHLFIHDFASYTVSL
ncbi:hypothetical protein LCGC14_1157180 [marine sediment metagenome]|uniref:Uncharacterized protein n=1 Tax=marine sediment metagenome TaxID=412755 RepID=A0A0F9LTQ9_9ZZZZ